jgi:hypothetical protein
VIPNWLDVRSALSRVIPNWLDVNFWLNADLLRDGLVGPFNLGKPTSDPPVRKSRHLMTGIHPKTDLLGKGSGGPFVTLSRRSSRKFSYRLGAEMAISFKTLLRSAAQHVFGT